MQRFALFALVLLLGLPAGLAQTFQNSGFEADPIDPLSWAEYGDGAGADPSNNARIYSPPTYGIDQAHEGRHIYGAVRDGSRMEGGIRQQVPGFDPGTLYALSVWVYTFKVGEGSGRATLRVDPRGGTNPAGASVTSLESLVSHGEWTQFLLPFEATAITVTFFLEYNLGGGGFSIVYFDEVSVIVNPDLEDACPIHPWLALSLTDCRVDHNTGPEAELTVPEGYVITGLGFRAWFQDITTIRVQARRLFPDGRLGTPLELRGGNDPQAGLEVSITLPPCYVMVGFGARAAYETDITTFAVWARPLRPDGTLGELEEFRAGAEPEHSLENQFVIEAANRAMTGAGMRSSDGNITGLLVVSCELASESLTPPPTDTPLATPTPTLPDTDQDGLPDVLEGWPPAAGQTHLLLHDSDGDGLLDGEEDANRNGVRDTGETDARHRDSDGDGLMDGIERKIIDKNPLDPGDPGPYTDADGDGLPFPNDLVDTNPDQDGDAFTDGYEAAAVGLQAAYDAGSVPPLGDLNVDGFVSNIDALIAQSLFLENVGPQAPVFQGTGFRNADPNRDGHISNLDALLLQSFFIGTLALLPL